MVGVTIAWGIALKDHSIRKVETTGIDGHHHRDPQLDNGQTVRDFEKLSPKGNVSIKPHSSRLRSILRRESRKILRARNGKWVHNNTFLRHDRTNAYINSHSLWKKVQDLCKFKPDKLSSLRRGNEHKVLPLIRKLFEIHASCWGKV